MDHTPVPFLQQHHQQPHPTYQSPTLMGVQRISLTRSEKLMVGTPLMMDVCTSFARKSKSSLLVLTLPKEEPLQSIMGLFGFSPNNLSFHESIDVRLGSTTISSETSSTPPEASTTPPLNFTFLVV
ncbi:hypothetical protein ERO13_A13G159450v2 [Gossypium hirsutum]|uniref:Uncharacterized protein n=2 Tax=Gossypium TaxID=3633 RepID=A0A5J5T4H9_GOSBA|nr:hypothetical protein ES319_A13G177600v1 [Gossypium barbadense]KAG4166867.1 hypothetical protein ERO13_A13G159450v2 [Gossypium hirsutum]TYG87142.1 hypothetical protein ES288_A13G189900v1 [Gossypium darwinii]